MLCLHICKGTGKRLNWQVCLCFVCILTCWQTSGLTGKCVYALYIDMLTDKWLNQQVCLCFVCILTCWQTSGLTGKCVYALFAHWHVDQQVASLASMFMLHLHIDMLTNKWLNQQVCLCFVCTLTCWPTSSFTGKCVYASFAYWHADQQVAYLASVCVFTLCLHIDILTNKWLNWQVC